mmetsp:Transcript_39291/g.91901  ORF Transcript_39291/g.91901 Transcript_39291/m.91901 type:complete len:306 (-) Transcript_39291:140-1057(-)
MSGERSQSIVTGGREKGGLMLTMPTAVEDAAINGMAKTVERWLDSGGSVDAACSSRDREHCHSTTLLMAAAAHGRLPIMRMLIARGAQIDLQSTQGTTALMHATEIQNVEAVEELIHGGANLDKMTRHCPHGGDRSDSQEPCQTATMMAASAGAFEVLDVLLKAGADATIRDDHGYSALDWAVSSAHWRKGYPGSYYCTQILRHHLEDLDVMTTYERKKLSEVALPDHLVRAAEEESLAITWPIRMKKETLLVCVVIVVLIAFVPSLTRKANTGVSVLCIVWLAACLHAWLAPGIPNMQAMETNW